MNEFDQFVKHDLKVKYYARYTDDFVILSETEHYLKEILPSIKKYLIEKLKLELHPGKVTITKFHRGVDFLGYVTFPNHKVLRTKTKKRMLKKLARKYREYQRDELSAESFNQSLQSYLGILSHAAAYELQENLKNAYGFRVKDSKS